MPGPSIEMVTFVALVVVQLAVKFWKSPLWQSMLSGVVKLVMVGAGALGAGTYGLYWLVDRLRDRP